MDSKKPYIKPDTFSGSTSENIDSFLKKYDRAAKINGWKTKDKAQYIVAFLEGPALTFYENSQHNNIDIPKWEKLEKTFRT
ncbi:jerky protein-like [Aphis craccivora]|uniref:Jerky protein-like n=1 Tax=Aphis craccivora TaxID=307492 RepID=A0A6G0XEI4_APHCR|nr:jerky protein-like [Aphis craccivora]